MTRSEYMRLRRWDQATQPAYNAGVMDGMDIYFRGEARPPDPDEGHNAPFDTKRYWRPSQRLDQMLRNHERARDRGRVDGWDQAQEIQRKADHDDWIESQVERGMEQIADFLDGGALAA